MELKELRKRNQGYFLGADGIGQKDLELVNGFIEKIELSRTENCQTLDNVEYTTLSGQYFSSGIIEFNTYHDDKFCIVESGSCNVELYKNEFMHSISGGCFNGRKDESKFIYKGKIKKSFWCFSTMGAGASHGLYFEAMVSNFEYNERAENKKHLTTKNLTKLSIYDRGADTSEYYRYIADGKAWINESKLNEYLTKYKAIHEVDALDNRSVYWILNPIKTFIFNKKEFDNINAESCVKYWNGNDLPHKDVYFRNCLITYIDRHEENDNYPSWLK